MKNANNSNFISASLKGVVLAILIVSFVSCKNKEEKPDAIIVEETVIDEGVRPALALSCYTYNENSNMINLEITNTENPVEGILTYVLAEKDKNTGTFSGEFRDGKLIGTYTFQSEGKESKRQVAFMLQENQLIEGYGDLNEEGTMFQDVNTVNYTSTMPLTKTDCGR